MPKGKFGTALTKIFDHKRYSLRYGYATRREADKKAAELRRNGHLARVSQRINWEGNKRYAVWVR